MAGGSSPSRQPELMWMQYFVDHLTPRSTLSTETFTAAIVVAKLALSRSIVRMRWQLAHTQSHLAISCETSDKGRPFAISFEMSATLSPIT